MRTILLCLLIAVLPFKVIEAQNNPPTAVNDYVDAFTQTPVLIDVLSNDSDPDGDSIFISDAYSAFGQVWIENQMVWFEPTHEIKEHHVNYVVSDGHNHSHAYIFVNLTANPHAPVAVQDTFHLTEMVSENLQILSNDTDVDGDNMRIFEVSQISGCSVVVNPDSLSVTVRPDYVNICSFFYKTIESGPDSLLSQKGRVIIYVAGNPDRPVVTSDTATTIAGISVDIPVMENDYDPQSEELRFYRIYQPELGEVEIVGNVLRYHPLLSYTGDMSFYYSLCEVNDSLIYRGTNVTVHITKNPHTPVAVPDTAWGMSGVPIIIDVMANDYDPDGDLCRPSASYGSTVTADNKILFTSKCYETGDKVISYRIYEVNNEYSISEDTKILIRLEPNPAFPVAVNDTVTTYAGVKVEIDALANDESNGFENIKIFNLWISQQEEKESLIEPSFYTIGYTPSYQSEGLHRFQYFIAHPDSGYSCSGRGTVVVNVLKQNYTDSISCNNIEAIVDANGDLFRFDYVVPGKARYTDFDKSHFFVPKREKLSTISQNRFFLSGLDNNNVLHSSHFCYDWMWDYYPLVTRYDWRQGPVSDVYDSAFYFRYSKVWKITQEEIDYHKLHYNTPDYVPINSIKTWPGNGLTQHGEASQIAPYYDTDGDAVYNPYLGDFPIIRGDECIFFMFSDDEVFNIPTLSPMKIEVHGMLYGYTDPDTALFNSVFVHYDLINRSSITYKDCYAGIMTDFDIGTSSDDFFRTDVSNGSFIGYNSLDVDGSGGTGTYGYNTPAQSVTVLAGPFVDPDGLDNSNGCNESINGLNFGNGIVDDERSGLSMASVFEVYDKTGQEGELSWDLSASEMYNYLQGIWDDETPMVYAGNAHLIDGAPQTKYMFPGDSDPLNYGTNCLFPSNGYNQNGKYWTEDQVLNMGSNRSGLGSMGPFTLAPGQVQEIDLAYCVGFGNNTVKSSLNQLRRNIDSLKSAVSKGRIIHPNNPLGISESDKYSVIHLYPNPASDIIAINSPQENGTEYIIFNFYGSKVAQGNISGNKPIVSISTLAPGFYIIRIVDGTNVSVGKFVKR